MLVSSVKVALSRSSMKDFASAVPLFFQTVYVMKTLKKGSFSHVFFPVTNRFQTGGFSSHSSWEEVSSSSSGH